MHWSKPFLDLSHFDPNAVTQALYATMKAKATEDSLISSSRVDAPDQIHTPFLNDEPSEEDYDTGTDHITDSPLGRFEPYVTLVICIAREQINRDQDINPIASSVTIIPSPWLIELQHAIYFCY
jgi:hypothetical protein